MSEHTAGQENPEIVAMGVLGHNYEDNTTVYTAESGAEVYHADEQCPHLVNGRGGWDGRVHVTKHDLTKVLQSWSAPTKTCDYCTLSPMEMARIAVQIDGLNSVFLRVRDKGQSLYHTTVTQTDDGVVSETREVTW